MKLEKPYKIIKPTDNDVDYSSCYLPYFDKKIEGWMWYKQYAVSLEEAVKLREMGFSNPTRMVYHIDSYWYSKRLKNHNDSNVKISIPTREQVACFYNYHANLKI